MIKHISHVDREKKYSVLSVLFFLSFYFQRPSIDIGFALKPFMLFSLFILGLLLLKRRVKVKVGLIDGLFFGLIIYAGCVSFNSADMVSSLRLLLGMILILLIFNVFKSYFVSSNLNVAQIETSFYIASFVFVSTSLCLYLLGLHAIGGNINAYNNTSVWGVNVDRGIPRLMGPLTDPNIFSFFCTPFFFFILLKQRKKALDFFSLLLVSLVIFLSFSRGGILAIILTCVLYGMLSFFRSLILRKLNFKIIGLTIFSLIILSLTLYFFISSSPEYIDIIRQRVSTIDSGSGRFEIWSNLLMLYSDKPVFGYGLYNFLYYNATIFGSLHYAHNTFLEILFDTGILGFFIYLSFNFVIFFQVRKLALVENRRFNYLLCSYIASVVAMNSLSLLINEVFFMLVGLIVIFSFKRLEPVIVRYDVEP